MIKSREYHAARIVWSQTKARLIMFLMIICRLVLLIICEDAKTAAFLLNSKHLLVTFLETFAPSSTCCYPSLPLALFVPRLCSWKHFANFNQRSCL